MNGGTEMDVSGKQSSEKRLIDYYYLAEKIECPGEPLVYWNDIEAAPTADAVEVVRCRECKQGEIDDPDFPDEYYCHAGCGWNKGDFYCAYGERKEGADNEP